MQTFRLFAFVFLFLVFSIDIHSQWVKTTFSEDGSVGAILAFNGNLFASTSTGGFFKSSDDGANWTTINLNSTFSNFVFSLFVKDENIFAGTLFGAFISADGGQTWNAINNGFPLPFVSVGSFINHNNNLFVSTSQGVYKSSNNGAEWSLANEGLINKIAGLARNEGNLFAATDSGVFISTNSGANWTKTNLTSRIYSVAALGTNIFAAIKDSPGGAYRSTDNGSNWTYINPVSENANSVHLLFVNGNTLFAGTVHGVYFSTNYGTNWEPFNEGFINPVTNIAVFAIKETILYTGLYVGGIWKRSLPELTSIPISSNELPENFKLNQNYPNPFNPTTIIEFSIPSISFIELKVFDVLGKEISTLVNEELSPDNYKIDFDGSGLASGIYFYRIKVGEFVETKKLTLIK